MEPIFSTPGAQVLFEGTGVMIADCERLLEEPFRSKINLSLALPDCHFTTMQGQVDAILKVDLESSIDLPMLHRNGNNFILSQRTTSAPSQLAFIAYNCSEVIRASKGWFTLHAACVEKNDRAILILGEKGSGKTSLAIKLCLEHGFRLVGNDLVIVGPSSTGKGMSVFAGSKSIRLRYSSMKINFPSTLAHFKSEDEVPEWLRKVEIVPSSIGLETAAVKEFPILTALRVHLDNRLEDTSVYSLSKSIPDGLALRENASRYIRGVCTYFFDKDLCPKAIIPSFDTPAYFQARERILISLIESSFHFIGGPIQQVTEKVERFTYSREI